MRTLAALFAVAALACAWDVQDKETIRQTFPAATRLDLDNVNGYIHVRGYSGSEIVMEAVKTIEAESQERLDAAKREVKLETSQSGGDVKLYVDGPFRCHCSDGASGIHDHGHRGYSVKYDFELKVPAGAVLQLSGVNGHMQVENSSGDFDLSNVNGSIEATDLSGSGHVHTVNGKITASFARNPSNATSFKTVNGGIEASFSPNLSADVHLKTFHGSAYTDFDTTALPNAAPAAEQRNGKFVYRSNRSTAVRIGSGGPEYKFETLNGSIRILKRGQ
jgi:phage baseplate assembly protein gpV